MAITVLLQAEANAAEEAARKAALKDLKARLALAQNHQARSHSSPTRGSYRSSSRSRSSSPCKHRNGRGNSSTTAPATGAEGMGGMESMDGVLAGAGVQGGDELGVEGEELRRSLSSRRVQRMWRSWTAEKKTTFQLAQQFVKCGVSGELGVEAKEHAQQVVSTILCGSHFT